MGVYELDHSTQSTGGHEPKTAMDDRIPLETDEEGIAFENCE